MISIIIPFFNEKENLNWFYKELKETTSKIDESYEIIFVDDGSTDGSLDRAKNLAQKDKNIRIFSFRKNQGKAEALTLGFAKAKGDHIVTLDADLQDKPSEIPKLLAKMKEGYDLVSGWRKNRQDPLPKIISSKLFNFLVGTFGGLRLHDYNCGLKAYAKDAAKGLRLYGGMHRFIPLILYKQGFRVSEEVVLHGKRNFGQSKYGFSKLWNDLPDLFTMLFLSRYSKRPLHFFFMVGGLLVIVGIFILGYLSFVHFEGGVIGRRPLLFLGVLFVLAGLQIFFTGFLADLIINASQRSSQESNDFLLKYIG